MMPTHLQLWLPLLVAVIFVSVVIGVLRWILLVRDSTLTAEQRLPRQFALIIVVLVGAIAIVLTLPVSESSRNQVLALMGVLISGVIAFSSTTIVANLMAGLVLRFNRPFRTGDFIQCNEFFGRVSEKGLLDTEIQTEQRHLVAIANSYLINNPVSVVRSSGTLITATVSIGYDVHHQKVTRLLEHAASNAGLEDGFVHVVELGDFSVSYRVCGLLTEVKNLITAKSNLYRNVLDSLHDGDVEIMSPNVVAQRPTDAQQRFIARADKRSAQPDDNIDSAQENVAFDKAEEAEKQEQSVLQLQQKIVTLAEASRTATDAEKPTLLRQLENTKLRLNSLLDTQAHDKAEK
ncbi:mechanosensitive ion channel family protein [Alteromonas oceanisediminis]|uniref:mechanosensitive ion channel family protein n=1 Tax=Alteromonas oceanisediminis TaxID=2836180 RepID=UPI001BDB12E1|nr:mechanosensitive ion channel domain-containing protein [Alteromonas oceanisediminis]MBT0585964.1 mechanosensitive ion channel [Alteromonas oceanisediminis]